MNLLSITSQVIPAVNLFTPATLQISSGYISGPDGRRTPTSLQPLIPVMAQVQAMTAGDLRQVEGLNLQGQKVAIYLNGEVDGAVRIKVKGGDLITISQGPHAGVYLVNLNLEQWNDWAKVAATLQNGS
jgi:hypothetical protein